MILPDFYIAGTQKGGTTSLHHMLESVPDIYFPKHPQEIHFFDLEKNYSQGLQWLTRHYSSKNISGKLKGQTSPFYMYHSKVASRIKDATPNAKFIFILRNPVSRAYSHYWNSVRYGFEKLSFKDALREEKKRLLTGSEYSMRHFSYVDRGHYHIQLSRFVEIFGSENCLVLTQDQLIESPTAIIENCLDFLDLEYNAASVIKVENSIHNPSRIPRTKLLQTLRPVLENCRISPLVRLLDKCNLKLEPYPKMQKSTLLELTDTFKDGIKKLNYEGYLTREQTKKWSA